MSIRRATLCYTTLENKKYNLLDQTHPLSSFIELEIKDGSILCNNEEYKLKIGEEVYFYLKKNVKTLTKNETERITLGAMILPLSPEMEDYYTKCIIDNNVFDQWDGEFEYLLGLMNELCLNDIDETYKWFDKASLKGFKFKLL